MFILEANQVKKYFGDRLILEIPDLKIYDNDKIGIVGLNGAGKTTFLNLLSGRLQPDEGFIKLYGTFEYITQFESENPEIKPFLSGGEKTSLKINGALKTPAHILLADEPTSNLDIYAIERLQKNLLEYRGSILLISHDRSLLNKVCNRILEIENSKITLFEGNYKKYRRQKDMDIERMRLDYEAAMSEKKRLSQTKQTAKERLDQMRHTPKRMGNSEARLHKNGIKGKKNQERFIKNIDSRIESVNQKLNELPRRQEVKKVKIDIRDGSKLLSKKALSVTKLDVYGGERQILKDVSFSIETGSRVAIIGANGSGKTTLIKEILRGAEGVTLAPTAKIAYFAQDLSVIDENLSIFQNIEDGSILNGGEIRTILARLGFRGDAVFKKASVLSGGEKVKLGLAKIFAADVNFLILDEPTNYLDIYAAESLQEMMLEYNGTILLVTHDRELIDAVADNLLIIKDCEIVSYAGGLTDYEAVSRGQKQSSPDILMTLENRLAYVTGRLSVKSPSDDLEALDAEFRELVEKIKALRN